MKPRVKTNPGANSYAAPEDRIIEIWDPVLKIGCLISVRRVSSSKTLLIEPYRADAKVIARINGQDLEIPT